MALTDKLTAIGDAIRSKMETTELIPLAEMPNKVNEVFDIGSSAGYAEGHLTGYAEGQQDGFNEGFEIGKADGMSKAESDFWDGVQAKGKRTNYEYAFHKWNCEYIRPKYKVTVDSNARMMQVFADNTSLKKVESKYFDFSGHQINSGSGYTHYGTFTGCSALEEIEDIGMQTGNYDSVFNNCYKLHTIAVMRVAETDTFYSVFWQSYNLQNITIEGTIGQNGFAVSSNNLLTHDSLMSIINALKTFTDGTTKTVQLGATNIAKLTDAEKAIATQKGWTLA